MAGNSNNNSGTSSEQKHYAKESTSKSASSSSSSSSSAASSSSSSAASAFSWLVWPAIITLPLVLTHRDLYVTVFPKEYYDTQPRDFWQRAFLKNVYEGCKNTGFSSPQCLYDAARNTEWPSPIGLSLGLGAVVVGQFFMLIYFALRRNGYLGQLVSVQKEGARDYEWNEGLTTHLAQPEGFVMLGGYLIGTWMLGLMPASYYSFTGGIEWGKVALQLLIQDFVQYCMHLLEHRLSPQLYQASHKPHHRFTNPRIFDAFNGSLTDTFLMILVPLVVTARLVNANVWSYMAFGSLYANWLTLIHCEYNHPWDKIFLSLGFGTAADHHVHHKLFKFNFGHLFMYWDRVGGTYKNPTSVSLFTEFKDNNFGGVSGVSADSAKAKAS